MPVWMLGEWEPEPYWNTVRTLANDLLSGSDLREWTVFVRAKTPGDVGGAKSAGFDGAEQPWHAEIDHVKKELMVAVPRDARHHDDDEPEDVASYIVLDLLDELVAADN